MKKTFLFIFLSIFLNIDAGIVPDTKTIPSNIGVQLKGHNDDDANLDVIAQTGFTWVRRGFIWESIEKEKGKYDFAQYDDFVNRCEKRGLSIIACLAFSNKLYGHVKDEPARSAYAAWAKALVKHFKGHGIVWEIWNEPNTKTFWGKHGKVGNSPEYAYEYTSLVKATIPEMRAADTECVILAGAVSNMWTESYKWMSYCFDYGMLGMNWDVWSVHPYGVKAPEDYLDAYAYTRTLMRHSYGGQGDDRIWINSERGFPLRKDAEGYSGGDENRTEEYQAWHAVRQYLIDLLEGLPVTIWYEWSGSEGFSLYSNGRLTKAGLACKELVGQLRGYKLLKRIPTDSDREFRLLFEDIVGHRKLVVWIAPPKMETPDKTGEKKISIHMNNGRNNVSVFDIMGNENSVPVVNGIIEIIVTGSPQSIEIS